jgi:hypothetical protein
LGGDEGVAVLGRSSAWSFSSSGFKALRYRKTSKTKQAVGYGMVIYHIFVGCRGLIGPKVI